MPVVYSINTLTEHSPQMGLAEQHRGIFAGLLGVDLPGVNAEILCKRSLICKRLTFYMKEAK